MTQKSGGIGIGNSLDAFHNQAGLEYCEFLAGVSTRMKPERALGKSRMAEWIQV